MHVPENAVLQTIAEREDAIRELTERGLPLYSDRPKNWDNLIALSAILAIVLDTLVGLAVIPYRRLSRHRAGP